MVLPFYFKTTFSSVSKHKFMVSTGYIADSLWRKVQFLPSSENAYVENDPELWILPYTASSHATIIPSHLGNDTEMPQPLQVKQVRKCCVDLQNFRLNFQLLSDFIL